MKTAAIIPAFNEEKTIGEVVLKAKKYADEIIVIDDGSRDKTFKIAEESGARVYGHLINRGLGGALSTGIKAALLNGADIILTLDADGQHDAGEIPKMVKPIINGEADFVVGSRFINPQPMPLFRRLGIPFFNIVAFILFGIRGTDTLCGMRAINKKAAQRLEIQSNGMEAALEIHQKSMSNHFRIKEVPIRAIYTEYSSSKGLRFLPGLRFLIKLFTSKIIK